MLCFRCNYIDVPKLKHSINEVLIKCQLTNAREHCLQSLANEMFATELINKEVQMSLS